MDESSSKSSMLGALSLFDCPLADVVGLKSAIPLDRRPDGDLRRRLIFDRTFFGERVFIFLRRGLCDGLFRDELSDGLILRAFAVAVLVSSYAAVPI